MRDHIAIVESMTGRNEAGFPVVHWCESPEAADKWLAQWLRDNKDTRPVNVRCTVAKCIVTIGD